MLILNLVAFAWLAYATSWQEALAVYLFALIMHHVFKPKRKT